MPPWVPRFASTSWKIWFGRFMSSYLPSTTLISRSTRSKIGVSDSSVSDVSPRLRFQCSMTLEGVRKQVPELMTVVPPSARPIGMGIAGFPTVVVKPRSR